MSFTSPTDGWVGSITRRQRLWKTEDGKAWVDITARLPPLPSAICGISSPSKGVVFASGTQYPSREAAIMHTADGGQTWNSISMAVHANLLIDTLFVDDLHGWVVGGTGGTSYDKLKPVVLYTSDGGKTWENKVQNSGIKFPTGEWGWKIQFLNPEVGFVSLENDTAAAILKTSDGGETWRRIPITDPQRNVELEGIGFINEQVGWVGGWGHGFTAGDPQGTTSGTTDGGETWFDANGVGRFINRFRFTNTEPVIAYASGGTIYKCTLEEDKSVLGAAAPVVEPPIPEVWDRLDIVAHVPESARQLTVTVFDPRQTLVKVVADEKSPEPGPRTFAWNFQTDDGVDAGTGHFMYRIFIDGDVTTGMSVRPARASPDDLGMQVADLIKRYAFRAKRAHEDLVLPDATGKPLVLKSLFDAPLDLMAALVRGGWIIPGEPDRSMFLVAIIGTGPMQGVMSQADIQLLSDWIAAGAIVPLTSGQV
ncbi:WD40/YVTN/BNR-like repeat-containing protein [Rhizobium leguminosarum]|uniref:WD40/YVTN/BNR-like repeat-containing protein n=2 Tax=Rhizobium/Agrobacterium group TaxID=227290 RepID=UPI00102F6E12|nr:hypothetical protein [Rhizobium leguminosarum]TAY61122.1 hypothetical protein ELH82_33050 [Rhizobium leguminosarum]